MTGPSTPAIKVLATAKVAHNVHRYTHDPQTSTFGKEAVVGPGVSSAQVFKTLVIELSDGALAIAALPVSNQLSFKSRRRGARGIARGDGRQGQGRTRDRLRARRPLTARATAKTPHGDRLVRTAMGSNVLQRRAARI